MKDLASLSSAEFKSFLDSFDTVLCDCDGVIFPLQKPITGARNSLIKLRECGKRMGFVTNNNVNGLMKMLAKFDEHELEINREDLVYPTRAMIDFLKSINFNKDIYLLGFPIMKEEFKNAGFKLVDLPDKIEESREGLLELIESKPNIGAVIMDVDLNLNFPKLFEAAVHLRRPDVIFMTGATDKNIPISSESLFMGPGYFQQVLTDFTGRTPLGFGKPGLAIKEYVTKRFNITNPGRTLFVGDSLEQDIGFANKCGYQNLLVLTGATTMDLVSKTNNAEWIPEYYVNSFGDLHKLIKEKLEI